MTNEITRGTNGNDLLPCWHCGGEVGIALHSNEFGEYWWSVQRGYDDETACKCRLFMESDGKFSLEEGEEPEDSPRAMELRARLVEKWNRRVAVTDHDFAMAVHDGELWGKCSECRRIAELKSLAFGTAELALRFARLFDAGFPRDVDRPTYYEETYAAIAERMYELGIEVDG